MYSEPSQARMTDIVKSSILDVWLVTEYYSYQDQAIRAAGLVQGKIFWSHNL